MNPISDGSVSWIGGMDTSRSPVDIAQTQYSRACNVFIPRSLGGVKVRSGLHAQYIEFDSSFTKNLYEKGHVQAEGYFTDGQKYYLVAVVDGIAIRFTRLTQSSFFAESLNQNNPNRESNQHWVIRIPYGCIVNNGIDNPIYITKKSVRRTNPDNQEIPPGQMGVYVQNRLFYVNSTGNLIGYSDFQSPIRIEDQRRTGIIGFPPPENTDYITAICRQKVMLNYAEGGALMFSTRSNIYSVDVRGDPNSWANQGSRVGKVTQTVEGLNATSPYSFEAFGTNIFFRNFQFGIADLRQSQYQFNNLDGIVSESIEAAYWLENDTPWMLNQCYSRSWNSRLFTTVAPEQDDKQRVFWNGLISYHPAAVYSNQEAAPRRYESLITGVRPWCMTSVKTPTDRDRLFIHSFDEDNINRLYEMVENSDFDINHEGRRIEVKGWVETRGYDFNQKFSQKKEYKRFYSLREFTRDLSINLYARTESSQGWASYFTIDHRVGNSYKMEDGIVEPLISRPQVRYQVNTSEPNYEKCGTNGNSFLWVQDRIEFQGPMHLDSFIRSAMPSSLTTNVYEESEEPVRLTYKHLKDFSYSIARS